MIYSVSGFAACWTSSIGATIYLRKEDYAKVTTRHLMAFPFFGQQRHVSMVTMAFNFSAALIFIPKCKRDFSAFPGFELGYNFRPLF